MANRARDWLNQAMRDLEQAEDSRKAGRHEWACFAAQQAAEKAVRALHLQLGQEAWGHVIAMLLKELPADVRVREDLIEKAHVLGTFYIPSRYPNSHPQGAPFEHYGSLQSEEAIRYARVDWGVGSDLDIVIIVEKTEEPFIRRAVTWDTTELPVPADVLVYTIEE